MEVSETKSCSFYVALPTGPTKIHFFPFIRSISNVLDNLIFTRLETEYLEPSYINTMFIN